MKSTISLAVVFCMLGLTGVASMFNTKATCEITSTSGVYPIYGNITLRQIMEGNITIKVSLKGFNSSTTQKHGFHVHEYGDLGNQCRNAGGHFNPANFSHGAPNSMNRHAGDLGNVEAVNGVVETTITDWLVTLYEPASVIGKAIVVHEGEDDLGRGNNSESLLTGNEGPRYGCCIITKVEENETMMTTTQPTGYTTAAGSVAGVSSLLLLQLIAACILSDRRH